MQFNSSKKGITKPLQIVGKLGGIALLSLFLLFVTMQATQSAHAQEPDRCDL